MKQLTLQLVTSAILFQDATALMCDVVECRNGGVCVEEEGNYDGHNFVADEHPDYGRGAMPFHCVCDSAQWTGRLCDIPVDQCSETHSCYNVGTCIADMATRFGEGKLVCDCTAAVLDGFKYEGKYCEHKIGSVQEHSSDSFAECPCLNGGHCKNSETCACAPGFGGRFCQFKFNAVPDCDLDCLNGGYCVFSKDEWNNFNQVCHCPSGFGGRLCEVEAIPCGEAHCYNGSTCVRKSLSDGIPADSCDCRSALSSEGKRFAGMYCQYEETAACTSEHDLEARLFCVNKGKCKKDGIFGCECPPGYSGFSCEFHFGITAHVDGSSQRVPDDVAVCDLDCSGHGTCRHGLKDTARLGTAAHASGLNDVHENLQHCVCEEGFQGVKCDKEVLACAGNEHFCLHGGQCILDKFGYPWCDCSTASGDDSEWGYYGEHCEFPITSKCTTGGLNDSKKDLEAFCVNEGSCKDVVHSEGGNPGCYCKYGWSGKHCEQKINNPTDVCTKGASIVDPSAHICHNGGWCNSLSDRGLLHPGCNCPKDWTGVSCDIPVETRKGGSTKKASMLNPLTIILLSLAVIFSVLVKLSMSDRWGFIFGGKKEISDPLFWVKGAPVDVGDEAVINLAPKAREYDHQAAFVAMTRHTSSRDPMVQHVVAHMHWEDIMASKSHSVGPTGDIMTGQSDTVGPMVDLGPRLDEDGFPLQNIEII